MRSTPQTSPKFDRLDASMQESIDELYARWQQNPDALRTTALCEALRGSARLDLVEIVGSHAATQLDVQALVAAARMYTDTGRLDDAQQVLVAAGRLAPRDGEVYRWLGEVLLRRGDAERAEKVLERAVQFAPTDPAANAWLDHARRLLPMQRSSGTAAVAHEIAQTAVREASEPRLVRRVPVPQAPAPRGSLGALGADIGQNPIAQAAQAVVQSSSRRAAPSISDDDVETQIRKNDEFREALSQAVAMQGAAPQKPVGAPIPAAGRPAAPPIPNAPAVRPPPAPIPMPTADAPFGPTNHQAGQAGPVGPAQTAGVGLPPMTSGAAHGGEPSRPFAPPPAQIPMRDPHAPHAQQARGLPEIPRNPLLDPVRPVDAGGHKIPEARDVLDALHVAGVFEPDGAVRPNAGVWDKPERGKRRIGSLATLITLAVLSVGGGTGAFYYVKDLRAKQHVQAEGLLAKIDADLRASDAKLLEPGEKGLAQAFELESRSPHAALTWLHERAMLGLLKGGENVAFEDSTQRAKEVGIAEKQIAFAYVASFLFQGDTAGAAAAVAKWDSVAQDDAWFQLIAGATFERAGDPRAVERYAAAAKLDPQLLIAQILLVRASAVDGDPQKAAELAKQLRANYPDRPEGAALVTLAWARDPARGDAPAEAKDVVDKADALPLPLHAVPHAARALLALEQHKTDDAKAALSKGLAAADSPGMAAWIGNIALATGDETLARKAALSAVSYSAVYPPARVLAARVALLGARLDEALKAAEELPAASADVAVVTAAVAYEKLDGERMTRALEAVPDDAKKLPFITPLSRGQALLAGNAAAIPADKALDMANDEAPWADLVAMDAALDTGDLDLAQKVAATWTGETKPLRALRLARLARYQGKIDDAEKFSRQALEGGTVTLRALTERVFTLVAANKAHDAVLLFKSYPNVGGPLAKWLRAYAVASGGKMEEARAMISQEDPPPALAPMPTRMIAVAAYGAIKDTRHGGDYVKAIVQAGFANPDVSTASEKLGGAKAKPVVRKG